MSSVILKPEYGYFRIAKFIGNDDVLNILSLVFNESLGAEGVIGFLKVSKNENLMGTTFNTFYIDLKNENIVSIGDLYPTNENNINEIDFDLNMLINIIKEFILIKNKNPKEIIITRDNGNIHIVGNGFPSLSNQ